MYTPVDKIYDNFISLFLNESLENYFELGVQIMIKPITNCMKIHNKNPTIFFSFYI